MAVGRTIFDRELFHVDLDDAPVFDADTDNLSVEPIFDDVVFEDIEPNFDDLDDEPLFDTKFDELDKGSVFDTESIPDHVAVSVFEFVRPEYDAELTVFDTDSDSLNDLPEGHIFDKETVVEAVQKESGRDYYTAHGSNSGGISSVGVSEAMFETIVRKILLDRTDCTLDFYEGSSSDWRLSKSGKPGNIGGFEDILFINNDMQESPVMTNRKLGLAEFREDSRFTNVGSALLALCLTADCEKSINSHSLQDAITKCSILLTERKKSNFKSKDLVQDLEKIRSSVKLVHDLISQFDYTLGALGALLSYAELLANDTNYGNYTIEKYNLDCYMRLDSAAM
ncbi:DNA mismatch repair protein MSH2 [Zea mays]|uniref:DNA mismatch repair protein MSH2 n=1 Tax=Zea mays TaxID=4577 RepID=A0A3L6FZC6_MAIZE|nr:DNA mismatch repair protein MSH2 [Zea mays]